jgi:long-subunit acyl-CoA synthetase (AMP-forming)
MLVNSFGKNIYPTPIENTYLKSNKIEQIFLIGDKQEYLTAIVVPSKEEMKEKFAYTDEYFEDPDDFIREEKIVKWVEEDMHKLAQELGSTGRILLRPSGTEPLIRVMVEAATADQAQKVAQELADVVATHCTLS